MRFLDFLQCESVALFFHGDSIDKTITSSSKDSFTPNVSVNAAMTSATQLSSKRMESLQNRSQHHSQAIP